MKDIGLSKNEMSMINEVLIKYPRVKRAMVFGSRAKGNFSFNSDVDIALDGDLSLLEAEFIASELELLPLPYKFDVLNYSGISNTALREHIDRVGIDIVYISK